MTGEELKHAIRGRGLTIEEAAEKLDISRQSLHYFLRKEKLSSDFLEKVKEKLDIISNTPLTLSESGALKLISENVIRTNAMQTVTLSAVSECLAILREQVGKEGVDTATVTKLNNALVRVVNQIVRQNMDKS